MKTLRVCVAIAPLVILPVLLNLFACSLFRAEVRETPTATPRPTSTLTPAPTPAPTPEHRRRRSRHRKHSVAGTRTQRSQQTLTPVNSRVSTPLAGSSASTPRSNPQAVVPQLPPNSQTTREPSVAPSPVQADAQQLLDRASKRLSGIDQAQLKDDDLEYYQESDSLVSDSRAALEDKDYSEARALALKALQLSAQISAQPLKQ